MPNLYQKQIKMLHNSPNDAEDSNTDALVQNTQGNDEEIEMTDIAVVGDEIANSDALIDNSDDDDSPGTFANEMAKYERLHLGLLQTLIFWISKSAKRAVITTIAINIILCSSDTTSDVSLCLFYFGRGLFYLAVATLLCDYVPGLIVFLHHLTSDDWKKSSRKMKLMSICALTLHPFSLLVTNLLWALDLQSQPKHKLARLSTILHGCTEAPMQFVLMLCAFSWAILPLPWVQTTTIVDSNDNVLSLGKITVVVFALTCIGIVKGSGAAFEAHDIEEELIAMNWAMLHLCFRLVSAVFVIIVLGIFSIPIFVVQPIANYLVLLKNDKITKEWASIISSSAVSIFVPTWISKSPHEYQIRIKRNKEETKQFNECQRKESFDRKKVSFRLAMTLNPIIVICDTAAFLTIKFTGFVQATIWTNKQLEDVFLYLILPMFALTIVVSIAFSQHLESQPSDNGQSKCPANNHMSWIKRFLSLTSLLGVIACAIGFSLVAEQLNRSTLVGINNQNEITILQIIYKGPLKGCNTSSSIMRCSSLRFSASNFRTTELEANIAYIDALPKQLEEINDATIGKSIVTDYYALFEILVWDKHAPEELANKNSHCKKCAFQSILCDLALDSIQGKDRCRGEKFSLKIVRYMNFIKMILKYWSIT